MSSTGIDIVDSLKNQTDRLPTLTANALYRAIRSGCLWSRTPSADRRITFDTAVAELVDHLKFGIMLQPITDAHLTALQTLLEVNDSANPDDDWQKEVMDNCHELLKIIRKSREASNAQP